jgi:hypothetical protein
MPCPRRYLILCYSFLLISNKFCDFSLMRWVGGGGEQCGKKNLLHCAPLLSPKAELWALESHVLKTTYVPLIDTALYVMLLMRANPLHGQVGGGWATGISTFLGPKWHMPNGSLPFHKAKTSLYFQGASPSHLPS